MYVCMYVCVYVRHTQKIAKLFFERAKHAVSFQIKYIIHKKIYQPLGPQNTPLVIDWQKFLRSDPQNFFLQYREPHVGTIIFYL